MKLVSILMPAYNVEKYISNSIESILSQTYCNFELIIVDDNSIDSTVELVKKYTDKRIKLIKNTQNIGVTANRNFLLNLAKGDYIAFFDSDDIASKDRIEKQVNYLNSNQLVDVVGSRINYIDEFGNRIYFRIGDRCFNHYEIASELIFNNVLCTSTIMFRSKHKHLLQNNIVNNIAEDYYLWVILLINKCKFYCIKEKLVNYRVRNSGSTSVYLYKIKESFDIIHSIILEQLNITVNSRVLNIHNGFFVSNFETDDSLLIESDILYKNIINNNYVFEIYENNILLNSIKKNWYLKCRIFIKKYGLDGIKIYLKSDFFSFKYFCILNAYYLFINLKKILNKTIIKKQLYV